MIRSERPGDVAGIHRVVAGAFPSDAEARLVDLLRTARHLDISLVAEVDGQIVGHVGFSPVRIAGKATEGLGLAPLAVAATHRQRGIGAALVNAGLDACRQRGCGVVFVLGDPAYYGRFGFVPASGRQLTSDFGGGDAFAVLELREGAIPIGGGLVTYAPEFSSLG